MANTNDCEGKGCTEDFEGKSAGEAPRVVRKAGGAVEHRATGGAASKRYDRKRRALGGPGVDAAAIPKEVAMLPRARGAMRMPVGALRAPGGMAKNQELQRPGGVPPAGGMMSKGGRLTAGERQKMPKSDFALPGKGSGPKGAGSGSYPIPDESHGRNALSRVSQHGSPEEKAKVRAAVHRKFPNIGKD